MTDLKDPLDPQPGWQLDHLRRYLDTGGSDGHMWRGAPTLLLTTKGWRSGKARRTPLIYGQDGSRYVVVASKGGSPGHPYWYRNLDANPEVRVQVNADQFAARARTATAAEKPALWRLMTGVWPAYDEYQANTEREIPVVILEPVDSEHG
jgi:deazaflavin-dependent oxidoreductase (nitroreductase family)